MKTTVGVCALLLASPLATKAQGVFLGPGDALAFGFSRVDACYFREATPPQSYVFVGFGSDILGQGESLRLEMFENDFSEPPFASQTYSPASSLTGVSLYGPGSGWLDYQGLIRISVLSGSVEVIGARFSVEPDLFRYCDTTVLVPERDAKILISLGLVVSAIVLVSRRTMRVHRTGVPEISLPTKGADQKGAHLSLPCFEVDKTPERSMLASTHTMKTNAGMLGLLLASSLSAVGQGVMLGAGDTLSFGFNQVNPCRQFSEPRPPGGLVFVGFGKMTSSVPAKAYGWKCLKTT